MPKDLPKRFTDEEAARAHLEAIQWPDGPICPHCGTVNRASRIAGGRKGLMFCNACRKQFSVTVGTVFRGLSFPCIRGFMRTICFARPKREFRLSSSPACLA